MLSHFARQPIKYRSFLVSIITITQIYEKIKNHLRNIQSGVMVLSPLHQTSSKPSWSFRRFWGHHHCHSVPPRRRQTSAAAQPPRRGHSLPPRAEASYLGPGGVKSYGARFTRSVLCKNKQDDMTAMSQDRGAMKSAGKGPICDITQMAGNSSIILFFFQCDASC